MTSYLPSKVGSRRTDIRKRVAAKNRSNNLLLQTLWTDEGANVQLQRAAIMPGLTVEGAEVIKKHHRSFRAPRTTGACPIVPYKVNFICYSVCAWV